MADTGPDVLGMAGLPKVDEMEIRKFIAVILIPGLSRAVYGAVEGSVFLFNTDIAFYGVEAEFRDEQNRVISVGESVEELRGLFVVTLYQILMARNAHMVFLVEEALIAPFEDFSSILRASRGIALRTAQAISVALLRTEKIAMRFLLLFGLTSLFFLPKQLVVVKLSIAKQNFQILRC